MAIEQNKEVHAANATRRGSYMVNRRGIADAIQLRECREVKTCK